MIDANHAYKVNHFCVKSEENFYVKMIIKLLKFKIVNMRLPCIMKLVLGFEYDNFYIFFYYSKKYGGGNNVRTY